MAQLWKGAHLSSDQISANKTIYAHSVTPCVATPYPLHITAQAQYTEVARCAASERGAVADPENSERGARKHKI